MKYEKRSQSWKTVGAFVFVVVTLTLAGPVMFASAPRLNQSDVQANLSLEIILPEDPSHPVTLPVLGDGRGMTLILRQRLKIHDATAAGGLTAVDVWADREGDGVRVRLSIIYNDLSNREWWKDKKEKIAGSYLVSVNEPVRPADLSEFGIEPFELRIVTSKPPETSSPPEKPRFINKTVSLKAVRLEKDKYYRLTLENTSNKDVEAFTISSGRSSQKVGGPNAEAPAVRALSSSESVFISLSELDTTGITIEVAIFDDGTFEGDSKLATQYLANAEGVKIQAPSVLRLIEETLQADDAELPAAFARLEAQLWVIPEAIDKQSALELLKGKFPSSDEPTVNALYEDLKGGLYDSRNIALSAIGDAQRARALESRDKSNDVEVNSKRIKSVLTYLEQRFEKIQARSY